jgi:hypothetical protein
MVFLLSSRTVRRIPTEYVGLQGSDENTGTLSLPLPQQRRLNVALPSMKFIFSVFILLILTNCSEPKKRTSSALSDTLAPPAPIRLDPSDPNAGGSSKRTGGLPVKAATWQYEKTTDQTGSPVYKASLLASNRLQFPYPYTGRSTATLTIRKKAGDTSVYLEVSNGQFNRSFQSGNARVRFDENPPVTYPLSAAANGRANIVFFDAKPELVDRIIASRALSIQVQFPGQRVQTIDFKTAGLRWRP